MAGWARDFSSELISGSDPNAPLACRKRLAKGRHLGDRGGRYPADGVASHCGAKFKNFAPDQSIFRVQTRPAHSPFILVGRVWTIVYFDLPVTKLSGK